MQPFQPRECLPITGAFGEHVVPQPLNVDMVTALGGVDDDGLATGTVRAGIAGAADDVRRRLLTKAQRRAIRSPSPPWGEGARRAGEGEPPSVPGSAATAAGRVSVANSVRRFSRSTGSTTSTASSQKA